MITLKEAYSKVSRIYAVGDIWDCGEFWLFGMAEPLDISATAVYKENGELFRWFPPNLTDEQKRAYKRAQKVPVPA